MKNDNEMIEDAITDAVKEIFPNEPDAFYKIITGDIAHHVLPIIEVVKIKLLNQQVRNF
jgi:hypothetical protein